MVHRIALVLLLLAACSAPAAAPRGDGAPPAAGTTPASQSASPPGSFQQLVAAANQEGKIVLWANNPDEKDVAQVQQAFNDRFQTNIVLEVVPMRAGDARTRIAAEAQGGRHEVDVISQMSTEMVPELRQRGLVAAVDWVGLFGQELPDVKDAYQAAFPDLRGYYLAFADRVYALAYNTRQAQRADLPTRWTDLADPKYRGKIAYDSRGFPFNYVVLDPDWGEARTERLVRDVAANQPLLQPGAPQIADAVIRGETALGVTSVANVLEGKLRGAPVDMVMLDYVPVDPFITVVAEQAPHPSAARLYAAWAVSDGMRVFGDLYQSFRVTQPGNALEKVMQERTPPPKVVAAKSESDLRVSSEFLRAAGEILTSMR
jgi:iron(III) transport system substrate-binding protein